MKLTISILTKIDDISKWQVQFMWILSNTISKYNISSYLYYDSGSQPVWPPPREAYNNKRVARR